MMKKLLCILFLGIGLVSYSQECPDLLSPVDGATNVPVDATITWEAVAGIPGYQIRLGTTPGGGELGVTSVGSATSYTPPRGLPDNTQIYVTIILDFLFQGGSDIVCDSQSFTTEDVTTPPACTNIRTPQNGAVDVSVFTNISWNYAPTATGYRITVGTTPGGNDVVDNVDVGNVLTYNPPGEFDPNTTFYVRIVPYNENGQAPNCQEYTFTTGDVAPLPGCTSLITPVNGAINVPLTPFLEWVPVPGATGYRVTIGTTPTNANILDNAVFTTNSTFVIDFEPNLTFFVRIVPFNASGEAIGCGQESFSTLLGCGPFLDLTSGEFVTLNPEVDFPSVFSFCENDDPLVLTAPIIADGYRWYSVDPFDNASLISEDRQLTVDQVGDYQLEVYDIISQPGGVIECGTTVDFEVVSSEIATIERLNISETALGLRIEVVASGNGDYEYAIDDINGPYQDGNVFNNVQPGSHTLYVRDKNGCGIVEESFEQDLTVDGFPKFFTPNGDNINDFWQFIQPEGQNIVLTSIRIFDRYGKFLREIRQDSQGWDGTFNGRQLPAGDYWYLAIDDSNREVRGHFSLKR